MEVDTVASSPNVRLGVDVDASKSNMEVDAVASGPKEGLGMDASRSNMELDTVVSRLNVGLDADASRPNVGWVQSAPINFKLGAAKDIIPPRVMTFARYLLNEVDLGNHNASYINLCNKTTNKIICQKSNPQNQYQN